MPGFLYNYPPMPDSAVPLYTAAQSRALDRRAQDAQGLSGAELMRRAAATVAEWLQAEHAGAARIAVYAGAGNNAGDGYLVALRLHAAGRAVRVAQLRPGAELSGDARAAWEQARDAGVAMRAFDPAADPEADLAVDALLGTGLSRAPEGDWARAVARVNAAPAAVAVDLPSGLSADTGRALGACVRARATVTFIGRKRGLYTADGPDCAGRVVFRSLGVDADNVSTDAELLDWERLRAELPHRARNTHKGDYGHVLVVGGAAGFQGAAALAGAGALRAGCGLVSVAQPPAAAPGAAVFPELMCHAVADRAGLRPLLEAADAVAVGPGLGRGAWAREMLAAVLERRVPLVVDADALRLLAAEPQARADWILTPHPGEAGALLGSAVAAVQQDRFAAARGLAERYGGVAVLKGCGTLVADAGGIGVCVHGNPGLATAGTGDVLCGVIAGFCAQGHAAAAAARLGVCLHGAAGDRAAAAGAAGLAASDLLPGLRALNRPPA